MTQRVRALTMRELFNFNAETVARPMSVMPSICVPDSSQRKWSNHCWVRGLKSGTDLPVCGSVLRIWTFLNPLQEWQARQRLSAVVSPPAASGMMWSKVKAMPERASADKQYAQRYLSSSAIANRNSLEMYGRLIGESGVNRPGMAAYSPGFAARRRRELCAGLAVAPLRAVGQARSDLQQSVGYSGGVPA